MGFFFNSADQNSKKKSAIPINSIKQLGCKVCPLARSGATNSNMQPTGSPQPVLYILGNFPKELDDERNEQFRTEEGKWLRERFPPDISKHIRWNNVIRTRTPDNRDPEEIEIEACRKYIVEDIEKSKPEVIIGLGKLPLQWALNQTDIFKWRGRLVPVKIGNHICWYYPIFDVETVFAKRKLDRRTGEAIVSEYDDLVIRDIKKIIEFVTFDFTKPILIESGFRDGIVISKGLKSDQELEKVFKWLDFLEKEPFVGFDYETQGFRPYSTNNDLLTVAIGTDKFCCSFPINYPDAWNENQKVKLKERFSLFIENSGYKICHNLKFEQEWTVFYLGKDSIKNSKWADTMAAAYAMDERRGMLSLDNQIRMAFGFWLKNLSPNLDKSKMRCVPLIDILPYNALDAKWTFNLYFALKKNLEKEKTLVKVYNKLIRSTKTLTLVQNTGVLVDETRRLEFQNKFENQLIEIQAEIDKLEEIAIFKKKMSRKFNPTAPEDLIVVLKDILQLGDEIRDAKGGYSTAEPILSSLIDVPIAKLILKHRGIAKKKSTYIDPLPELIFDRTGRLHTNFNQFETTTGRLSSSDPNLQNFPNRKGKEIRSIIVAPENNWIVSGDYGQIEARILGVASQDVNFCDALWDNYDVHMEWAERIAIAYPDVIGGSEFLKEKAAMKAFRSLVKNKWVFPAFYGSSIFSISKSLGIPIDVAKELFREFWSIFKGIKQWQKWMVSYYNENGYVETLTGRRRHGPLTYNELINAPIQGTASDICVEAMDDLVDEGIDVIMNVHDDVTSYVPDDVFEPQVSFIAETMSSVSFKWINVPIAVELSAGKDWFHQEEIGTFYSTDYIKVDRKPLRIGDYQFM